MSRTTNDRVLLCFRFSIAVTVFSTGLIAVVPQPTATFWKASLLLSEGGYWLAALAIPIFLGWRRSPVHLVATVLAFIGTALLVSPVIQAFLIGRPLPDQLSEQFGMHITSTSTFDEKRQVPLSLSHLIMGISSSDVIVDEHVYDVVDGYKLTLDLYRPKFAEGQLPIVVMIHGGAWTTGNKRDLPSLNEYLAARGYVVAAISYRLVPFVSFPAPQRDVSRAIDYLKGLTDTHGVDSERIALVGRSAGGQIALLAAYNAPDSSVRGVVSFYAPTALRWGYSNPAKPGIIDSSAVLDAYLGGPPTSYGEKYNEAEPSRFVNQSTPPTLLIQGLRDEHVSPFHAEFVSARLIEADVPHFLLRLPWATHGCDYFFRGPCGQISTFAIEWFLETVLK